MLLKFISSICGHRLFVFLVFEDILCAVIPVCPADPVCWAVLPSAAGSYITELIRETRITCSALTDTHSFTPALPQSVSISSYPLPLVSIFLLCYFHLAQLNPLLNALFPSVSLHYPSLLPLSLLFLSVSLWLHPKIPSLSLLLPLFLCYAVLSISRHLSSLTISVSLSLPLSPSGLQLKYYKCYCILARGQMSKGINQYSERIM